RLQLLVVVVLVEVGHEAVESALSDVGQLLGPKPLLEMLLVYGLVAGLGAWLALQHPLAEELRCEPGQTVLTRANPVGAVLDRLPKRGFFVLGGTEVRVLGHLTYAELAPVRVLV